MIARVRAVTSLLLIACISLPGTLPAQADIVRGPLGQRLDSLLTAAAANGFHGNALIAQRGEVVLLKGYGFANHEANTRYGPSTLVQIGSNVKDITKVAIFQLVERGRLRLTDSLGAFIPDLASDKRGITIAHLMHHTAGLPLGVAMDAVPLTRTEMLNRLNTLTLASAPGATERYSNLGYALLAYVVERLSGQSYDAYVAEHILRPAGMRETGTFLPRFDRARIAHGYSGTRDIGIILDMPHDADGHLYALRGNGGYLSTLTDMRQFYQALRGATLLREPTHRRAVFDPDGADVFSGSDLTSFFLFANFPGVGAEVIVASNHSAFRGNRLLRDIERVLGVPGSDAGPRIVMTNDGPGPDNAGPMADRLPDNGIGRTIAAYIESFNTGDTAVMRRFFVERAATGTGAPPLATRLERYLDMRSNLGRLTFRGIRQAPDGTGWAVTVSTSAGEQATLTFVIDADPPHRMLGLRVEVGD